MIKPLFCASLNCKTFIILLNVFRPNDPFNKILSIQHIKNIDFFDACDSTLFTYADTSELKFKITLFDGNVYFCENLRTFDNPSDCFNYYCQMSYSH